MKKIVYIFVAALLMVACKPNNEVVDGKVRLTVSMDDNQSNKSQQRISAIDNGSAIDLTWEVDDVLTAYDGGGYDVGTFTLIKGAGTKTALFESNNFKGDKENFTLRYVGSSTWNITQVQTMPDVNKINENYLKLEAKNCKIGGGIQMTPCFAVLGIQLIGNGTFQGNVAVGYSGNYMTSCIISMDNSVALNTNPTYYILFPCGEDGNIQHLDKVAKDCVISLFDTNSAQASNTLKLNDDLPLSRNQATILKVSVTKNENETGANQYAISKTQP